MTTTMQRIPEPELMDEPAQARAYAEADFSEPNALFVSHFLSLAPPPTGRLIDLGCGPGDICIRLAGALPGWSIVGLDAGPNMLALADDAVRLAGLADQIELVLARLPELAVTGPFDALVSNSLLHHLPDPMLLWQAIGKLGASGSLVQVMDLSRPESETEVHQIVATHAASEPEVLRQDFHNSLCAAWRPDEVQAQLEAAGLADRLAISHPSDRHWLVSGKL